MRFRAAQDNATSAAPRQNGRVNASTLARQRIPLCVVDPLGIGDVGAMPANVELVPWTALDDQSPELARIEVAVVADAGRRRFLAALDRLTGLRVIQSTSAGVDWLAGHVPAGVRVHNARGVYDGPLAEWVVGAILAMNRGLVTARDAQALSDWRGFMPIGELAGADVVILGQGSIGSAVAERLRPFGAKVTGVGRSARDGIAGAADLERLLPATDVLVNLLPLTRETVGLVDARLLGLLPDGALLVNAGRGRTTVTSAMTTEAKTGRLRAVLDVTHPEPLPPDHPLWSLPNVLITPHVAGDSPLSLARAFALAGDQIRRYAAGEPLINEVAPHLLEAIPG
jgi:phosphoglycerate dehydrogenase-like enzyme